MRCIFWWGVAGTSIHNNKNLQKFCSCNFCDFSNCLFSYSPCADALAYPATPPYQNKNTPFRGYFYFWWEWLDSNQLRLKPTDLQSAPALQLRRTPELLKNCQKREYATILIKASVQSVHDRNQNQADSIFHNFLVRAEGIEPSFQAWKACILAFVLCPQQIQSLIII